MPVNGTVFENEQQLRYPSRATASHVTPSALPAQNKTTTVSKHNQCRLRATPAEHRCPESARIPAWSGERRRRPISVQAKIATKHRPQGTIGKAAAFVCGLGAYLVFLVTFLYAIEFISGFV